MGYATAMWLGGAGTGGLQELRPPWPAPGGQ